MAKITITAGEGVGQSVHFDSNIIMGRSPEANFTLQDLRASRKHSRIAMIDGAYYLEDLKSHNGTFLNGKRVHKKERLKSNDNIRIGATWLNFIDDEEDLSDGGMFCGYNIVEQIYESATGNFYYAQQTSLGREVLLWALSRESLRAREELKSENSQDDFLDQIRKIANLSHRNVLMVLDFAVTTGYFYCVFERVPLESTLAKYIEKNALLPLDDCLDIAQQLAQGLSYAHQQKVLHLHLTTKNVLIQHGYRRRVVLTDLGVSRFLSKITHSTHGTSTTGILGISDYIAPEQVLGDHPESKATDVYSFGCFLYHILAAEPPFKCKSPYELARSHCQNDPVPIGEKRPDLPRNLTSIIEQCLRKSPQDRCSLGDVLEALQETRDRLALKKVLESGEGRALIKSQVGERVLLRWWIILPLVAILANIVAFFAAPLLTK